MTLPLSALREVVAVCVAELLEASAAAAGGTAMVADEARGASGIKGGRDPGVGRFRILTCT